MENSLLISLLITSPIGFLLSKNSINLQKYIQKKYPLEWQKASSNRMKMNITTIRAAYLSDSLKFGFLCQQNDAYLIKLMKLEKKLATVGIFIVLIGVIASAFN
jgi:hypothetical protein